MNLIELSAPAAGAYPVAALAAHLRLGTGFADDGAQDTLLEALLQAAVAALEARTGKVLLERRFAWELTRWHGPDRQGLPVGPVSTVETVTLVTSAGAEVAVPATAWRLVPHLHRPELVGGSLPAIPIDGHARIEFTAGFGPAWTDVPPDLGHAALLLAAHYHERRADGEGGAAMPFGVQALADRYRIVRLGGDRL